MRLATLVTLALIACKTDTRLPVAYTLRGKISLALPGLPPNVGYRDDQLGGDLHFLVNRRGDEGYCFRGVADLDLLAARVVVAPSLADLRAGSVEYVLERKELPDQTYPFDIYPTAILQATSAIDRACEASVDAGAPRINAIGVHGVTAADVARGPTSPCCGFLPKPITITGPGMVIDADFVLTPAAAPFAECPRQDQQTEACELRHPPGSAFGDGACAAALGAEADVIFPSVDSQGETFACGVTMNGYTLRGKVRYVDPALPPGLSFVDQQFGGDLLMAVYDGAPAGYCLRGAATLQGAGPASVTKATMSALRTSGVDYVTEVRVPADQGYPFAVYPTVAWKNTVDALHACEAPVGGGLNRFNAVAVYGYGAADYALGPNDACCGYVPRPLMIHGPGEVIDHVDFVLSPAALPNSPCPSEQTKSSHCELRGTLCAQSLGADAASVFVGCP